METPPQHERLLIFNLRTDVDDHILGFTTRWINELAVHYRAVDVLTTHAGRIEVTANVRVYSTGREKGASRLQRFLAFYRILAGLLLKHHYDACFAHMQPMFAVMGAPLLKLRGVPITTWYTHRQLSRAIHWAERVSYRIATAVPSSFPLQTPKVRAIGHGIDVGFFSPDEAQQKSTRPRIVYVARLTEIKHQHILLEAIKGLNCEVVLVGDVPDGFGDSYKQRLLQWSADAGLQEQVIFAGAQTPQQVRDWYRSATLAVNLSPPGLFDKAALEAMAVGVPTIVSNDAFLPLMGSHQHLLQIPKPDDTGALRARIQQILALSDEGLRSMRLSLRANIRKEHSLMRLIPRLIQVMHTGDFE